MYITKIEPSKGKRYKIFCDDNFLFSLYGKELKKYNINIDTDVREEVIVFLKQNIVLKRAKERALYLIERRPLTKVMLKNKLKENDYPEDIVEEVVDFLEKYKYLDDRAYFLMYLDTYSKKKSKRQMICDLLIKGIDKEIIETGFHDVEYSEGECCCKQIEHYLRGKDYNDSSLKQKTFQYLYRKGFSIGIIKESIEKYEL